MQAFINWAVENSGLVSQISKEIMMAFIVTSIEILPGKRREYRLPRSLLNGILWPWTILTWFVLERGGKRIRLLRFVWAFLITGWYIALLYYWIARTGWQNADLIYAISAWSSMSFLAYCIESKPAVERSVKGAPDEPLSEGWRLWLRTVFWFTAFPRWFRTGRDDIVIKYSRYMWAFLITGWFWALLSNWLLIWAAMSFLTYCIEAMPNKNLSTGGKLYFRTVFWMTAVFRWFTAEEDRAVIEYTTFMWIFLTICWLLGINEDVSLHHLQIMHNILT
jgi:hypothetical protein